MASTAETTPASSSIGKKSRSRGSRASKATLNDIERLPTEGEEALVDKVDGIPWCRKA
jgi:hypothetical protein